jgi:hypothetical protein
VSVAGFDVRMPSTTFPDRQLSAGVPALAAKCLDRSTKCSRVVGQNRAASPAWSLGPALLRQLR